MKIRPVGAELFHAEGRTDIKLRVAFRNFANAPKKQNYNAISFVMYFLLFYSYPVHPYSVFLSSSVKGYFVPKTVMELGPIVLIRCAKYFTGLL
jgi:hypothetical protein